jgi:hypothetical protein
MFVEHTIATRLSRRRLLAGSVFGLAGAALAACGEAGTQARDASGLVPAGR